jgi:hypothetical protein
MRTITMHRLQELVRLHRLGNGAREVARLLEMSPNTERDYRLALSSAGLLEGDPVQLPELAILRAAIEATRPAKPLALQQTSSVERWRPTIEALANDGASPTAIYDKLRIEHKAAGFDGSLSAVKRLYARIRVDQGISPNDVAIPVDTQPGHVGQVDFGSVGKLWDPVTHALRDAFVFVLVLAYSRHQFCKLVFNQKIETWLALHVEALGANLAALANSSSRCGSGHRATCRRPIGLGCSARRRFVCAGSGGSASRSNPCARVSR